MNNEQQELLDEVYKNYWRQTISNTEDSASLEELDGVCLGTGEWKKVHRQFAPKQFINKCKTDTEFSEKWGLKIEERELTWDERHELAETKYQIDDVDDVLDKEGIPTKLITITYNDKTIESYD